MADRKATSKVNLAKRKEKNMETKAEKDTEKKSENKAEKEKVKDEKVKNKPDQPDKAEDEKQNGNGEAAQGAQAGAEDGEFQLEPMELPPFEIIVGKNTDGFPSLRRKHQMKTKLNKFSTKSSKQKILLVSYS